MISNGVLNLAFCKRSAFAEVARVLKPGGRFQAADLVLVKELPHDLRDDQFAWSNCISGAIPGISYLESLQSAGFVTAEIVGTSGYRTSDHTEAMYIRARKPF